MNDPQSVGKYKILEWMYSTALERVYLASDPHIGKQVTLVLIGHPSAWEQNSLFTALLSNERRALTLLQHPNIPVLFDAGEENGLFYLAMERFHGPPLATVIERKQEMPLENKLELIAQVADALSCAHKHGIVHGSLEPDDIVVNPDGVAKLHGFYLPILEGSLIGKAGCPSPEQIRGERADHRTDIFSLGAVLYQLVTYSPPFRGENFTEVMLRILTVAPASLEKHIQPVPVGLQSIVNQALAKDRTERYPSAEGMARDLRTVAQSLSA